MKNKLLYRFFSPPIALSFSICDYANIIWSQWFIIVLKLWTDMTLILCIVQVHNRNTLFDKFMNVNAYTYTHVATVTVKFAPIQPKMFNEKNLHSDKITGKTLRQIHVCIFGVNFINVESTLVISRIMKFQKVYKIERIVWNVFHS